MYRVFYTTSASTQLRRLPREIQSSVVSVIESLTQTPRTFHTEKLTGYPNAYRLRVGRYRVVYTIEDELKRVVISRIAHRREAYR